MCPIVLSEEFLLGGVAPEEVDCVASIALHRVASLRVDRKVRWGLFEESDAKGIQDTYALRPLLAVY
jgi:hypothetical protein